MVFWLQIKTPCRIPALVRYPIIQCGRDNRGLTLFELLAVMAIIAILATIAMVLYYKFTYQAQIARVVADIATIGAEISTFQMMNERLPVNLAEINRATFKDPWGNPYEYFDIEFGSGQPRKDHNLHPINSDFDLYSKGRDGDSVSPLTAAKSRDDIIRANERPVHRSRLEVLSNEPEGAASRGRLIPFGLMCQARP